MRETHDETRRAHPRSRGENDYACGCTPLAEGSSPLTRGKRHEAMCFEVVAGLIPAHAGKTDHGSAGGAWSGAHPRSRGENRTIKPGGYLLAGSSPLTRGKRGPGGGGAPPHGLIPAHAGKTRCRPMTKKRTRAHPRSRGENRTTRATSRTATGSSPLTRGKLFARVATWSRWGLIPAHAGKTKAAAAARTDDTAHPRSRGENALHPDEVMNALGSSPLTRGKLLSKLSTKCLRWLIPAHAGKTGRWWCRSCSPEAHPRSRGENTPEDRARLRIQGSSPLTRGKRYCG